MLVNSYSKQEHWLLLTSICLFALSCYLAYYPETLPINQWAMTVASKYNDYPVSQALLPAINWLGSTTATLAIIATLSLWLAYRRYWLALCYLLAVFGTGMSLVLALKLITNEPRPNQLVVDMLSSFPSGHTARATLLFGAIIILLSKTKRLSKFNLSVLIIIPILVGLARIASLEHHLTDVVASYALSLIVIITVTRYYCRWFRQEIKMTPYCLLFIALGYGLAFVFSAVKPIISL